MRAAKYHVAFTGSHFTVDGAAVEGVHPVIASTFFPFYTWERAKFGPRSKPVAASVARPKNRKTGMEIGKALDEELARITEWMTSFPELLAQHFSEPDLLLPTSIPKATRESIRVFRAGMGDHTMQVCRALTMHNLRPVRSQLPVGHELLRVATAVDLVCIDKDGHVVLIEIKSGFDSYYYQHTERKMDKPFQDQNDSPSNQNQIQLGLTMLLYCRTYGVPLDSVRGMVIRSIALGITTYPLVDWVRTRLEAMQMAIAHRNNVILQNKVDDRLGRGLPAPATTGMFIAMKIAPRATAGADKSGKKKTKRTPPNGVQLSKLKAKKTRKKKNQPSGQMLQRTIAQLSGPVSSRRIVTIKKRRK